RMRFQKTKVACLFIIVVSMNVCANPQSNETKGIWDESVYTADTISLAEKTEAIWIVMNLIDSKLNFATGDPQKLLNHYFSQPESKRSKGIFIYSKSFAVPDIPEERMWMTEYLQRLYDDPIWRKSESDLVENLIKACISKQVPLYVNT